MFQWLSLFLLVGVIKYGHSFDSYVLSLQWIPGICEVENKCDVTRQHDYSTWTIHGLWPDDVQYCSATKFDPDKIQGIFKDLTTYWPTYKSGGDEKKKNLEFWEYEYSKHGKCALSKPNIKTELQYFEKALELVKKFNLYEIFSKAGISPSNSTTYTKSQKDKALQNALGKSKFKDECQPSKTGSYQILTEQRICLDLNFNVIDCPSSASCDTNVGIMYVLPPVSPVPKHKSIPIVAFVIGVVLGVFVLACLGFVLFKFYKTRFNQAPDPYSRFI